MQTKHILRIYIILHQHPVVLSEVTQTIGRDRTKASQSSSAPAEAKKKRDNHAKERKQKLTPRSLIGGGAARRGSHLLSPTRQSFSGLGLWRNAAAAVHRTFSFLETRIKKNHAWPRVGPGSFCPTGLSASVRAACSPPRSKIPTDDNIVPAASCFS